jgi:hypothetical protein
MCEKQTRVVEYSEMSSEWEWTEDPHILPLPLKTMKGRVTRGEKGATPGLY